MNIYLIRHGRQNSDLCNVNVPLCEAGKKQAELVADRLKRYQIGMLFSSDLIRAKETAEIINQTLHVPHMIDKRLREISFGKLEGLSDAEIIKQYGEFIEEKNKREKDIAYPGGECGADVFQRGKESIKEWMKSAREQTCYQNIAVVTHGGWIRSILAGVLQGDFAKKLMFAKDLENCSITQLRVEQTTQQDRIYIERVNDFAHLEQDETLLRKNFKKGI